MKKLVWAVALVVGLSSASGCIITTDDNDEGAIGLDWQLTAGDANITCRDAEADTIEVISDLVGSTLSLTDLFDCVDLTGVTADMPVGLYDVEVFARDEFTGAPLDPAVITRNVDVIDNFTTEIGLVFLDVGLPAFR